MAVDIGSVEAPLWLVTENASKATPTSIPAMEILFLMTSSLFCHTGFITAQKIAACDPMASTTGREHQGEGEVQEQGAGHRRILRWMQSPSGSVHTNSKFGGSEEESISSSSARMRMQRKPGRFVTYQNYLYEPGIAKSIGQFPLSDGGLL
jgi:hypothetical protein